MLSRISLLLMVAASVFAQTQRPVGFHRTIGPLTVSTKVWSNLPDAGTVEILPGGEVCVPDECARVYGLRVLLRTTDQTVTAMHVTGSMVLANGDTVHYDEYVNTRSDGQFSWVILGAGVKSKPQTFDITITPARAEKPYWPTTLNSK